MTKREQALNKRHPDSREDIVRRLGQWVEMLKRSDLRNFEKQALHKLIVTERIALHRLEEEESK
jgi:hypothetical protein